MGGFELVRELGQGSTSAVYLARCPRRGSLALKLYHAPEPGELSRLLRRATREAHALSLIDHPAIVRVLGHERVRVGGRETVCCLMEVVEGTPLHRLQARAPVEPRWALEQLAALARGLELAHRAGLVHRDIKPSNVHVSHDGARATLLDFGLVKLGGLRSTVGVKGSYRSMAPEQLAGGEVDARADVYALGGLLLWLLTGIPANPLATLDASPSQLRAAVEQAPPGADVLPFVDAGLAAIWSDALAADPEARPASGGAFADRIATYLARADDASGHELLLTAGAPPARARLSSPVVVVGACQQSVLRLASGQPEVLFRLLRPVDGYALLPVEGVRLMAGPFDGGRRTLRHLDAIDAGPLRFVYRRYDAGDGGA